MAADKNDMPADKQKEELERLVKKADHLSNFGTLTSLISTAAYFIENTFIEGGKKLPKWLSIATLSAVGVGIVSVISSYYYKLKAGRIALDASGPNKNTTGVAYPSKTVLPEGALVPAEDRAAPQKWTRETGSAHGSSSEPGR